jgi:hypothetical protein
MAIKHEPHFFHRRKEMAETYGWLFIDSVPLLYDKKKVARQFQVEMWLDLTQLVKELQTEKINENKQNTNSATSYIV